MSDPLKMWKEPNMSEAIQEAIQEVPQEVIPAVTPTQFSAPTQLSERRQEAYRVACDLFRKKPDWVTFFREVLGVDGVVRRLLKGDEIAAFQQGPEHAEIQAMVAKLRGQPKHQSDNHEPTRVITVRLPKSLHEYLRAEAHQRQTSMNQLCISKLLQIIDGGLVPSD